MMEMKPDNLTSVEIKKLLARHLNNAALHSPPEAIFALDLEALKAPEVTFWSVWHENTLLGCGALKEISPDHGEIKSMHTCDSQRGKGVASFVVDFIIQQAIKRKYQKLSLETGTTAAYVPAHRLYQKFGFVDCAPFADYFAAAHSVFMALTLSSGA